MDREKVEGRLLFFCLIGRAISSNLHQSPASHKYKNAKYKNTKQRNTKDKQIQNTPQQTNWPEQCPLMCNNLLPVITPYNPPHPTSHAPSKLIFEGQKLPPFLSFGFFPEVSHAVAVDHPAPGISESCEICTADQRRSREIRN